MVQKNSAALEAASNLASSLSTETQQKVSSEAAELSNVHSAMLESSSSHCKALDAFASGSYSTNKKALDGVSSARGSADGVLVGISNTVGTKRKFLDTTVTTLVGDVGKAITQGCVSGTEYLRWHLHEIILICSLPLTSCSRLYIGDCEQDSEGHQRRGQQNE